MIGFGQGIYGCTDSIATNYNPNAIENGFIISDVLTSFGEVIIEIPFGTLIYPDGSTNNIPAMANVINEDTSSYTNTSVFAINDTISNGSLILEFFNGYPFDMSNVSISIFECSSTSSCNAIGNYIAPLIISGTTFVDSISLNGYNLNNSLLVIIDNIDWNSSNGPVLINYTDAMIIKLSMTDVDMCTYIYGCTNFLACNYNFLATIEDSSCILPDGCTDQAATNYDPAATCDDGSCTYQMTYVPDDNFENYLEANGMGDGIQLNDSINFWAIEMLMNLDVSNQNISDLTGVEDFTVISNLDCSNNNLTNLDLSQNLYLEDLDCQSNQLTGLDVSNNTALTKLQCSYNQLTSLDVRNGNNTSMIYFNATNNLNLSCINVDDFQYSLFNWTGSSFTFDTQMYFSNNCPPPSAIQEYTTNKELLKVTDLLGRETKGTKNEILFYIYDDGTVEKRIVIE